MPKKKQPNAAELDMSTVYDLLMQSIEPDLIRKNLPTLEQKYKNESEAERKARLEYYAECLALFDELVADCAVDAVVAMAKAAAVMEMDHLAAEKK